MGIFADIESRRDGPNLVHDEAQNNFSQSKTIMEHTVDIISTDSPSLYSLMSDSDTDTPSLADESSRGSPYRYQESQRHRTLSHPTLPQDNGRRLIHRNESFSFCVCADSQIGITSKNKEWETELGYCRSAIHHMNQLENKPLFCCVCGDLVDMVSTIFAENGDQQQVDACNAVQDAQNEDWKQTWDALDPSIALVCVCGNHDVGNRPNKATIERFNGAFGDDYLAFWARNTYNIVLNTCLFNDPTDARQMYQDQLRWLEERLAYARKSQASHIFVFGHHPWFLYSDDENEELEGASAYPKEWGNSTQTFPDKYFHIPYQYRREAMALFARYQVTAAFAGHFHQNHTARASFGMEMIVTSSLSIVFESSGIKDNKEPKGSRGLRIVNVHPDGTYDHKFHSLVD